MFDSRPAVGVKTQKLHVSFSSSFSHFIGLLESQRPTQLMTDGVVDDGVQPQSLHSVPVLLDRETQTLTFYFIHCAH